jgi:hypothetical protein
MFNRVDIDEKWFYLTPINTRYILMPGVKAPHQAARHKSHIPKAMRLTAMARPRKDPVTGVWWDGKIGTWFFVRKVATKRGSKNRPAGTLVTETYNVNKENSLDLYMDKLLLAIVTKWPAWEERIVQIQLDNAPVHPRPGRLPQHLLDHLAQLGEIGWDINCNLQPPNSPDTNTLDLAFFRAIQTIQYQKNQGTSTSSLQTSKRYTTNCLSTFANTSGPRHKCDELNYPLQWRQRLHPPRRAGHCLGLRDVSLKTNTSECVHEDVSSCHVGIVNVEYREQRHHHLIQLPLVRHVHVCADDSN